MGEEGCFGLVVLPTALQKHCWQLYQACLLVRVWSGGVVCYLVAFVCAAKDSHPSTADLACVGVCIHACCMGCA